MKGIEKGRVWKKRITQNSGLCRTVEKPVREAGNKTKHFKQEKEIMRVQRLSKGLEAANKADGKFIKEPRLCCSRGIGRKNAQCGSSGAACRPFKNKSHKRRRI